MLKNILTFAANFSYPLSSNKFLSFSENSNFEFMIRFALANDNIDVALVATTNHEHLLADIAYAAKGPLPQSTLDEAKRQLLAAGCGPGLGKYKGGGPSAVL